jgi:hypothetical protein
LGFFSLPPLVFNALRSYALPLSFYLNQPKDPLSRSSTYKPRLDGTICILHRNRHLAKSASRIEIGIQRLFGSSSAYVAAI